eukprot:scaffold1198_cov116-Isochrysis_galbana.AAC.11
MLWLPKKLRADYGLRQQWIDNNLTYLDAELLELYLEEDHDYMTLILILSKKKALHTSGDSAGHPVPDDPSALTPLSPIISPSLFLIQAALAGGWFKSCVHYNSLQPEVGS